MNIKNSVVLITGANRGIGLAFAKEVLARGAKKVYAAARNPDSIMLDGVEKIKLDVSNQADVDALVNACSDLDILINNAGIALYGNGLEENDLANCMAQMETNVYGPLRTVKALAPILKSSGGGAILNVLSVASWISSDQLATYSASKSAAWALTNSQRIVLKSQGTLVSGLHMGFVDTDLTEGIDAPKSTPEDIVKIALDGLEAGQEEILADDITKAVKSGLVGEPPIYLA